MRRGNRKSKPYRILIDVATQRDFLVTNAPMAIEHREEIVPRIRALMGWARAQEIPVVSCIQACRPGEDTNGRPRHCVDDTPGQSKLPFTLMQKRLLIEADNSYTVPIDILTTHRQVIFRKRTEDMLANPKADRLLNDLHPDRFIIFGVGLESWIRILALGLLARQKQVSVVRDACGFWDSVAADLALRQLEAKGVQILQTDELTVAEPETQRPRTRPVLKKLHEVQEAG
ncbi:MAG: isochorismatase family protein [Phycisphaerae bacterium]|nr:isochorismatase family protein [Phycisphaerae bacterium]